MKKPTGLFVTMLIFLILIGLQANCQIKYFLKTVNEFQGKNLRQKLDLMYNIESYKFVKYGLLNLSGRYQGQLITDSDYGWTIDPYLIMYYFYPTIDMRGGKNLKKCLVVFNKKDALSVVPDDYDIIGIYNPSSLLAVEKK